MLFFTALPVKEAPVLLFAVTQEKIGISPEIFAECRLILSCTGLGIWLLLCFDGLRIFRMACPHPLWLINLEDFVFWLFASLRFLSLLRVLGGGMARACAITTVFFAMLLYHEIISKKVLKQLQKSCACIRMIISRKCRKKSVNIKSGEQNEVRKKTDPHAEK